MCDFANPKRPFVDLKQCAHGTVHLTVGVTTLHLTPSQVKALHKALSCAMPKLEPQAPGKYWQADRFGTELN